MTGRVISIQQRTLLSADVTAPTYLIDLEWDAQQLRYSTNGSHIVDGVEYAEADVGLRALDGFTRAVVYLHRSPERMAHLVGRHGAWRGRACVIWLLPAVPDPESGVVTGDRILLLDGVVDAASADAFLELHVVHGAQHQRMVPSIRIGPPWCHHLPQPGTVHEWDGERVSLEE